MNPYSIAQRMLSTFSQTLRLSKICDRCYCQKDKEATLDFIFEWFSVQYENEKFDTCNTLLSVLDISKMTDTLKIGILTITLSAKSKLSNRQAFYDACYEHFMRTRPLQIKGLLGGLE